MADTKPNRWYKQAIFYQALVSAYNDSTGDGIGTLAGVREKLDYLQWLGVDCLWLPPFYDSPMRDGGYDIADYTTILPAYGTMSDFEALIDDAHSRGMKIITDLALNHTSDQHYWFQQSRLDPDGPYGDYYVWGDDPHRYPEIRIIFTDVETSNWAFDEVRGQFYFHRFYSHQPDLNYDCPAVHDEVLAIIRFWMDKGLDGFRLDAIPYLYERDGLGGESLPETHEFIRKIRNLFDTDYPDAIMLAEANQPPEQVLEFFGAQPPAGNGSPTGDKSPTAAESPTAGEGDQFHMCFNFPLMPRIFLAVAQGKAAPISELMATMPELPASGQWATFLRNHDELTLEMVTEAERELLYSAYAPQPHMRAHVGISRRLAPLAGGNRVKLELFKALLLAMPGSPFIFYGDEIGMGDNLYLPDRDSVRTPMQWSAGRNAGFSTADPEALHRPVIANERFGFRSVNVDSQLQLENSLLQWFRKLIHIRKAHPAFGVGDYREISHHDPNSSILAFSRTDEETLVCVFNFAPTPQAVQLDLSEHAGKTPVELTGKTAFPPISDEPWTLTLPAHGFFWFALS